jgi:hypothetical protein
MKSIFTFGKKKRTSRKSKGSTKKKVALPPKKLLKICKALKVKVVTKRGSKRVYKSILVLKKLCLRKIKVLKKKYHSKKSVRKVVKKRKARFGMYKPFTKSEVGNGYGNAIKPYAGVVSKTAQGPGINRDFFGTKVPAIIPANYNFMYQPNGSMIPVGYPFQQSSNAYGRRRRRARY